MYARALYQAARDGTPAPLPEPTIQYIDFAHWQRQWLQTGLMEDQLAYWKKQLGGALPVLDLPTDLRVLAIDLRGYGSTEHAPIDATRGVRDFSDDVRATLEELQIPTAHFVGWSMGAGVVMQYALEHPVLSMTLEAPISP